MKRVALWMLGVLASGGLSAAEPLFAQDFSQAELGELSEDFMVIEGLFAVKEEGQNRFVELPGAPLETYYFLFGPNEPHGVAVTGRIYATKTGRKFPTLGLGSNGVSGYRLQVAAAKGALELLRGDTVVASAPFDWKSATWTEFQLTVRKVDEKEFQVEGRAWVSGAEMPKDALVTYTDSKPAPSGRASAWGLPYSGTPIRFDDLKVVRLGGS